MTARLIALIAFVAAPALASVTAGPQNRGSCTVYEMRNQGGTWLRVRNGQEYNFARSDYGTTGISEYPEWNDDISSARLDPGCTLTVWEHINRGGQSRSWSAAGNRGFLLNYPGDFWNDRISSLICQCH